jgi:RNA recognition motif-containing protein
LLVNEVNDQALADAFWKYSLFAKAKTVWNKRTHKSKGFGFVSFLDSADLAKALREMQGE